MDSLRRQRVFIPLLDAEQYREFAISWQRWPKSWVSKSCICGMAADIPCQSIDSYNVVYYTHDMSKRLQVVLSDREMKEIQAVADQEHMTVSEWVRHALRAARKSRSAKDAATKIAAIRAASRHRFPTGDIEQMLDEIEKGYLS